MDRFAILQWIGIGLTIMGIVPWTIGGFISFRTQYDVHNRHIRSNFDPGGKSARVTSREIFEVYYLNPKSRWWCLIGSSLALCGMALITLNTALYGNVFPFLWVLFMISYFLFLVFRTFRARGT